MKQVLLETDCYLFKNTKVNFKHSTGTKKRFSKYVTEHYLLPGFESQTVLVLI